MCARSQKIIHRLTPTHFRCRRMNYCYITRTCASWIHLKDPIYLRNARQHLRSAGRYFHLGHTTSIPRTQYPHKQKNVATANAKEHQPRAAPSIVFANFSITSTVRYTLVVCIYIYIYLYMRLVGWRRVRTSWPWYIWREGSRGHVKQLNFLPQPREV